MKKVFLQEWSITVSDADEYWIDLGFANMEFFGTVGKDVFSGFVGIKSWQRLSNDWELSVFPKYLVPE